MMNFNESSLIEVHYHKLMTGKVEYIRYLHQFLLDKGDRRSSEVRDWLYLNSGNDDIIMITNIEYR
jgi:hypothetical protein